MYINDTLYNKEDAQIILKCASLIKKLQTSPKYNTYENYGQKEKRNFLNSVKDYHIQGVCIDLFSKARF